MSLRGRGLEVYLFEGTTLPTLVGMASGLLRWRAVETSTELAMWCKNKNCPIFRECDKSKEQWEICVETAGEKNVSLSEGEMSDLVDISYLDIL